MTLFPPDVFAAASALIQLSLDRSDRITTAESCTGGLIAGALTEISGSSAALGRGFVTYSNEAKQDVLGVPADTIENHGAVSEATVRAMAEGALARCNGDATVAVAVSGVAGPGGGTADKPVGTVWLAVSRGDGRTTARRVLLPGDRTAVRVATVAEAIRMLTDSDDL